MTMPRHVTDMDNKELGKFIIDQMVLVESGYITEAKQAALAFQDAGIEAGCFVKPGGANLTPRETMLWYAGQLIFGFGIYELFISDIDVAKGTGGDKVLYVSSLDELKDKIAKVIVMVLVVSFFQRVLHTDYKGSLEMLYFAISITALSLGLYFLHKGGKH
jgi:hypothetical protein